MRQLGKRRRLGLGWICAAIIWSGASGLAQAEYRAGPGDVIEIAVFGIPELQRKASIELDGMIAVPLAGPVQVRGLTLAELRARIQSALSGRVVNLRGERLVETAVEIKNSDILVSVATYRPIYVKGHVTKPGEYPYRGPMTIREAVALAGGYPLPRNQGAELALTAMDLGAKLESLWREFVRERARIWRIKVELGDVPADPGKIGSSIPPNALIARSELDSIVQLAVSQLKGHQASYRRARAAIEEIIAQLQQEIAITEKQVAAEELGYAADYSELKSLRKLKARGVVTSQRFTDARRAVLFSSTRRLQASVRLNNSKRQLSERKLQLHKLAADRRTALYQELETAVAKKSAAEVNLRSTAAKLQIFAGGRLIGGPQRTLGGVSPVQPVFMLHRRTAGGLERRKVLEDAELQPGDAVDVVIHGDGTVGGRLVAPSH